MKLQLDLYSEDTFIKAHLVSIHLDLNSLESEEHELAYHYDRTMDKRKPQKRITEFLTRHVYEEYEIEPPVQHLKQPNEIMTEIRFRAMSVFGRLVYIRRKVMKYYRPSRSDGRRRRQWDERP